MTTNPLMQHIEAIAKEKGIEPQVIVTALEATPAVPIAMQSLVALVALVLLLLVVFRLADPPDVTFLESTDAPGAR